MKMLCILCLKPSDDFIHIFEEEGLRLNICTIIIQHFSLQPSAENANNKVICGMCWAELDTFHKFYAMVEEAHSQLISTWSAATVETPPSDILSDAIRISGIKADLEDESDGMETLSSDDESEYSEVGYPSHSELKVKRTSSNELDQVIKQHMKLSCNICQEVMGNFYLLKRHFEDVHNESGYVICCKLKFKSRKTLAEHIYLDHNLVDLCDKCGQVMADCRDLSKITRSKCQSQMVVTQSEKRFQNTSIIKKMT